MSASTFCQEYNHEVVLEGGGAFVTRAARNGLYVLHFQGAICPIGKTMDLLPQAVAALGGDAAVVAALNEAAA